MTRNEEILALVRSGVSYQRVAQHLGITRNAVAGVCNRAGLRMDPEHISKNLRDRLHTRGWRSQRIKDAVRLRQNGLPYREIAKRLGYAHASSASSAIYSWRERNACQA